MRRLSRLAALVPVILAALVGIAAVSNGRVDAPTAFGSSRFLADPPPPLTAPITLDVVTFNIADGYLFTGNRSVRMRAIAGVLRDLDPDLVGLQEAFIATDRQVLWRALEGSRLRHQVRFPGATVGNGLWILSAHPIEEAWFHRYENAGAWYRFWEGDWWAGKGVGLARVRLPGGAVLDFFDTHAQAGRGNPDNATVRHGQMDELARFVGEVRNRTGPALVVGDFNTRPGAPDYEHAVAEAGLVRAMSLASEIDHIFSVRDERHVVEVLETEVIEGTTPGDEPELFIARPPTLSEFLGGWLGEPGTTRLSDHPGYRVRLRIRPRG